MLSDPNTAVSAAVALDHVEFYVGDAEKYAATLVDQYAFRVVARSRDDDPERVSVAVRHGEILIVLTQAVGDSHPAAEYVASHGDGVANIAFGTSDVAACFTEAVAGGAHAVAEPAQAGGARVAAVRAFGDVVHTMVERSGDDPWCPPGLVAVSPEPASDELGLRCIDHFAVCVEAGRLDTCVRYYEAAFGFRHIFSEHIIVGDQAMNSKVVQSVGKGITLTILEPDTTHRAGQIDDFISHHGGAGVQHLAFSTTNAMYSVGALRDRGVEFLSTPESYYDLLPRRVDVSGYDVAALRDLNILVDTDHAGQLFQIFTRSQHSRRTLFFEVIERRGAETFGSGNIRALYQAVEHDRILATGADFSRVGPNAERYQQ